MDFELSTDQVALQDAARDLLAGHASPTRVRAVVEAGGGFDPDLWAAMVEQGWTGIAVPEELGGVGLGLVELAVLLERLGATVAPAPFLQQAVALDALARAAADGVAEAGPWIERLVSGSSIATVAARPVSARSGGTGGVGSEGWVLAGTTEPAVYAPSADVAIVIADEGAPDARRETGDGTMLVLVDLRDGGRPSAEPAMDRTREVGWLRFDATPAVRLGGTDAVEAFVDVGAMATSAELLGAAAAAMDASVAYAKDREQFGRPIGSFQAVKHRCADMLVDVEGMRSSVYYAAWCLAAGDPDRSLAASTAKTWCADASKRVMASALQVHGGIGFTWECDVHLYLKRAQLDQLSFGDAVVHRQRLASRLRARVESGTSVI